MGKRNGSITLLLLITLSGVLVIIGGLLHYTLRFASAVIAYEEGLRAVYAAESGAQWGLAFLHKYGKPHTSIYEWDKEHISYHVEFKDTDDKEVIVSRGTIKTNYIERVVRLECTCQANHKGNQVIVNKIGESRWKAY